ncbi:amino acid ABC transporter permease [Rhizobium esperanzae]|uniref:Glutamate/aspartate import permease protein GltK n=1 Tax=Rhizobium esperanzae TaxID=1967781 RepID=A0A7W6R3Y9_9HYPH|nr:amino acid ABC transporter permease [Rhizobium esperanzae]MBB4236241.1 polar amino acid transport system permease protein [Rhizobium esperanzae]
MSKILATSIQHSTQIAPGSLKVVPLRHPLRVAAISLVALGLAGVGYAFYENPNLQWPVVGRYMFDPVIVDGVKTTLLLTVVIMLCAVVLGTAVALMMLSPSKLLSVPARAYIWLFRGAPALVQIILWYNLSLIFKTVSLRIPGVGTVFSVSMNDIMTPITAAVVALSLHESGYMAEIIRGGLKAVAKGQTEAAISLGMTPSQLTRRIVLPQAMRIIIPPTGNEAINLLKMTSLVSVVAVQELLYSAQSIYARTFETMPLLLVVTCWYLIIVSILTFGQYHLEQHFSRDEQPLQKSFLGAFLKSAFNFRHRELAA